ncbi:heart- and neural crest derivatives-expressed protein 1 isoform X2 [Seriola dumerili]|uniref:heart- and neural crest derivatives-expressed protein 1 isoform X2 n=1 Tax=Seriola dumerili TaxID=41447 RepID=UPI000BBE5972|nr:heart- and neural crest derivatives-expressed protein 1 isoform X2 [Seriola dumerili]
MNLIGGYQHHHHLMHEPFPFVQRCHQDAPYFQSWVVNHGEVPPDFQIQAPYPAAELGAPGATHDARLEGLQAGMGKRRASGPKKERRRTESINTAFAELRECIPNVPADTKLSKIKTLRLATSYIAYLMDVLAKDSGETEGFKAEIKKIENRDLKRKRDLTDGLQDSLGAEKKVSRCLKVQSPGCLHLTGGSTVTPSGRSLLLKQQHEETDDKFFLALILKDLTHYFHIYSVYVLKD